MLISSVLSPIRSVTGLPDLVLQQLKQFFPPPHPPKKNQSRRKPTLSSITSCIICSHYLIVDKSITQLFRAEQVDFYVFSM